MSERSKIYSLLLALPDEGRKGEGMFRLSGLGYCPRRIALSRWLPREVPDRYRISRLIGHTVHKMLQEELHLQEAESEVRLSTPRGFVLKGHIDGLLDGELIELKITYWGKIDDSPFTDAYRTQVMLYAYALGLDHGRLVFVGKDGRVDEEVVEVDDGYVKRVLELVDELLDFKPWEEWPEPRPSRECEYCPYAGICGVTVRNRRYSVSGRQVFYPLLEEVLEARNGREEGGGILAPVTYQRIRTSEGRVEWAGAPESPPEDQAGEG